MPSAWRRFWRAGVATILADNAVIGALLLWHFIGAMSSDDGYNLTIARISGEAGYTANYYRFFGASEAPFDWYQSVLAHMASISAASVWMRIPATLAGIATWLIISRCVLPRLGRPLAAGRIAVWTAGAVFLAAWLPFNNGLRPEPLIAFGTVAGWVLVERAIGSAPTGAVRGGHRGGDVRGDPGTAGSHRAGAAAGRRHARSPGSSPQDARACWHRWRRSQRHWR